MGALTHRSTSFLKAGDARALLPGAHEYIHQVWHLERPTVTLVLRSADPKGVFSYLGRSGLAAAKYQPAFGSHQQRKLQAVEFLRQMGSPNTQTHLEEILLGSEAPEFINAVLYYRDYSNDVERLERTLRRLRRKHGSWVMKLREAQRHFERLALVDMSKIDDLGQRVFLLALLSFDSRPEILNVIRLRYPDRPPETLITGWLRAISAAHLDAPNLKPFDVAVAKHLFAGRSDQQVVAQFAANHPHGVARAARATIFACCRRLRADPVLRPLFQAGE